MLDMPIANTMPSLVLPEQDEQMYKIGYRLELLYSFLLFFCLNSFPII